MKIPRQLCMSVGDLFVQSLFSHRSDSNLCSAGLYWGKSGKKSSPIRSRGMPAARQIPIISYPRHWSAEPFSRLDRVLSPSPARPARVRWSRSASSTRRRSFMYFLIAIFPLCHDTEGVEFSLCTLQVLELLEGRFLFVGSLFFVLGEAIASRVSRRSQPSIVLCLLAASGHFLCQTEPFPFNIFTSAISGNGNILFFMGGYF